MAPLRLAFLTASMMTGPERAVETRASSVVSDENDLVSAAAAAIKPMKTNSGKDDDDDDDNAAKAKSLVLTTSMSSSSGTAASSSSTSVDNTAPTIKEEEKGSGPVHFCFIVHGHQGKPTDLSYLHHTIKDKANQHGRFATTKSSESCSVGSNGSSQHHDDNMTARRKKRDRWPLLSRRKDDDNSAINQEDDISQTTSVENVFIGESKGTFIVHNAACNEGTTHDGVEKGGERLANEMLDVIRSELGEHRAHDVTISIVGNSLGGLYGRYAVAKLDELLQISEEDDNKDVNRRHYLLDNNIRIHFNVFCSTASPHLGCADRTYVPIPRFAEIGIAAGLGETGRDLFRVNDLMRTMATSPKFTRPLALFRKRIAYANAYGTDFVVPGSTAAFLDGNSDSLHYFDADFESERRDEEKQGNLQTADRVCPASEKGLFVATCHTPRLSMSSPLESTANELEVMSKTLDSLGWTKVFVDIRREIPISAKLPSMSNSSLNDCPIRRLSSNRKAVSSKDLCNAISSARGNHISLPFGHNAICAFERGSFSTAFNKGGRPVMDSLAINLVEDISMWTQNVRNAV